LCRENGAFLKLGNPRSKTRTVIVEKSNNKPAYAALTISVLLVVLFIGIPLLQNSGLIYDPGTGQTVIVGQGVKVTGVAVYANDTAVDGQTIRGMTSAGVVSYIATTSDGSFTSNRGPAEGGTFDFYMSIAGCRLFVGTFDIPAAEDYLQETYSLGEVLIYVTSDSFVAMLIGSATNTATISGGTGSAGTTNYTASDGVVATFTLRLENQEDYSKLFRQYTDPRDDIALRPLLWLEIASTNVYCSSFTSDDPTAAKRTLENSTARMFLFEIDEMICSGTASVLQTWNFELNFPSTGTFKVRAYLCDGSYLSYVEQAKARVADPNTSETITTYSIVNAWIVVS